MNFVSDLQSTLIAKQLWMQQPGLWLWRTLVGTVALPAVGKSCSVLHIL
jgi:hypothetical protein